MTEGGDSKKPNSPMATPTDGQALANSGSEGNDAGQKPGHHNPTALEVIQALIDPGEEEKASAHMKGHISKAIIDDTFLFEAKEIYPESTLRINCMTHNAPATFYSKAE